MSTTYPLRMRLVNLARADVGKTEVTKNRAPWIEKLWPATSYPDGYKNREPYCASGLAYNVREWVHIPEVAGALGMTVAQAEKWRCKSAAAFEWEKWAKSKGLQILPKNCILHAGDIVIYDYSHIELVTDDDGTTDGPFTGLGYNTNNSASRDGEGCFEKPRSRSKVKCFIRILP